MNWMSILGLCLIVLGTIFSFFGTVRSSNTGQVELTNKIQEKNRTIDEIKTYNLQLIGQNGRLLKTSEDVTKTNNSLFSQNKEMLDKVGKYQSDIEERNKKIEELEKEIDNVKEYGYYATLNPYGVDTMPGYGITLSSDLYNRMNKILTQNEGKIYVKPDISIMPLIDEVIKKYPRFPFGYWSKYQLIKMAGYGGWKPYAQKAIDIFRITITITGHNNSHDEALKAAIHDIESN